MYCAKSDTVLDIKSVAPRAANHHCTATWSTLLAALVSLLAWRQQ